MLCPIPQGYMRGIQTWGIAPHACDVLELHPSGIRPSENYDFHFAEAACARV
jgi:hypothetical protein